MLIIYICFSRETRRAIERQNRIERARRRNEEVSNVRNIVLLAKENDPRILAANKAARDAKEAKRQARLVAVQKRREMEEEVRYSTIFRQESAYYLIFLT